MLNIFSTNDKLFFKLLQEHGNVVLSTSCLLLDCIQPSSAEQRLTFYRKIQEQKLSAVAIEQKILSELSNYFWTPLSSRTFKEIIIALNNIICAINNSAKLIVLYAPKNIPEGANSLSLFVREGLECVVQIIQDLENKQAQRIELLEACEKLLHIQKKSDDLYEHLITDIFTNIKDTIEVVKLKDIAREIDAINDSFLALEKTFRFSVL